MAAFLEQSDYYDALGDDKGKNIREGFLKSIDLIKFKKSVIAMFHQR